MVFISNKYICEPYQLKNSVYIQITITVCYLIPWDNTQFVFKVEYQISVDNLHLYTKKLIITKYLSTVTCRRHISLYHLSSVSLRQVTASVATTY